MEYTGFAWRAVQLGRPMLLLMIDRSPATRKTAWGAIEFNEFGTSLWLIISHDDTVRTANAHWQWETRASTDLESLGNSLYWEYHTNKDCFSLYLACETNCNLLKANTDSESLGKSLYSRSIVSRYIGHAKQIACQMVQ